MGRRREEESKLIDEFEKEMNQYAKEAGLKKRIHITKKARKNLIASGRMQGWTLALVLDALRADIKKDVEDFAQGKYSAGLKRSFAVIPVKFPSELLNVPPKNKQH